MGEPLNAKALEAAHWAFAHEAENMDVSQQDCINTAIRYYLAALPQPQATTVGVTEALRQLSVLGDTFVPSGGFDDMHAGFVHALTVLRSALIGIPGAGDEDRTP